MISEEFMGNETKSTHRENGTRKLGTKFTLHTHQFGLSYAAVTISKSQWITIAAGNFLLMSMHTETQLWLSSSSSLFLDLGWKSLFEMCQTYGRGKRAKWNPSMALTDPTQMWHVTPLTVHRLKQVMWPNLMFVLQEIHSSNRERHKRRVL